MGYHDLIITVPWSRYSKKMTEKILSPRNCGYFTMEDGAGRGMKCIEARAGSAEEGNLLALYWLVDETDGIVVDAKFQVFGQSPLIAAAEAVCELLIGKNYDQAKRISAELIDKRLRDKPEIPAFPEETLSHLNLAVEVVEAAAEKCAGLPLAPTYISPVPKSENEQKNYPPWISLSHEQKLALIDKVLTEEVRPYIELDEGGIEVQALVNDKEIIIAYQGSCTSCFSAIGATLSTIQQIVCTKIHPDLVVVPNMDALHF